MKEMVSALSKVNKRLVKALKDLEKKRTSGDNRNYSIAEIGQNT